jgi:hypothetical protein
MIPAIFIKKKLLTMPNQQRKCLSCERILQGRQDKKFCDDYCRSAFNNKKYVSDRGLIRRVNYLLLKNRRILEYFLKGRHSTATIMRKSLSAKGFQFDFFTHTYHTVDGKTYFCCYDHAYSELFNEEFIITRIAGKSDSQLIPYTEYERV